MVTRAQGNQTVRFVAYNGTVAADVSGESTGCIWRHVLAHRARIS